MSQVATTLLSLLLSFALNAKAPDAFITMSAPHLAFGLMFPLQMPHSLLSTMGRSPGSLLSSLLQPLVQASAYPFTQNQQAHLASLSLQILPMGLFQFLLLEEKKRKKKKRIRSKS